ncbi:hypothetical protein H6503_05290 [Candidatus Woesearchaeota archaeon]|nr:hypothetical protein [Candidatus Woesearchaeota archaeon]
MVIRGKSDSDNEEKAPEFLDINAKTLRNNFGYPMKSRRKDLFNSPSASSSEVKARKRDSRTDAKHIPTLVYILVAVVIVILAVVASLIYLNQDSFVEDGTCYITVKTIESGKEVNSKTDLNIGCNYDDDCRNAMYERNFPYEDIKKMKLDCAGK